MGLGWWVGGRFNQKILPLCDPILQAETCQISARLKLQDRDGCFLVLFSLLYLEAAMPQLLSSPMIFIIFCVQSLYEPHTKPALYNTKQN